MAQLVVLKALWQVVWRIAHTTPMGGHLGHNKTFVRITRCFFWPKLHDEVAQICAAYPECKKAREVRPLWALLQPMPVIDIPFSWMALEVVSPLPKSSMGNQ